MKKLIPFAFLIIALNCFAADAPQKLAYEQKDAVWVANIDGTGAKKISDGQSPDISRDGSKLVFNTVETRGIPPQSVSLSAGQLPHRQIAVADLASGSITILKDIPCENCMEAMWSPDGTQILFYYYEKGDRRIGVVNADGTGFRDVQKSEPKHVTYWSGAWAADGQSIYCQDMETLYHLDLDAKVLKKWKIEKLVPGGDMSGDVRLDVSPDGKTLLMDINMDEKERKGWEGPPSAIWTMDLATEKVKRLTPKALYGWESHWLDADNIVFISQAAGEKAQPIYRMSLTGDGKDKKVLVKEGRVPSVSK